MREILFRGKRKDNGEWIEGCLSVSYDERVFIVYDEDFTLTADCCGLHLVSDRFCEVIPETVGQFTGLPDKNGTKNFEGDVLLWGDKTAIGRNGGTKVVVEFRSGAFGIFDGKTFNEFWHYASDKWDGQPITDDMWGELDIAQYFRACFEVIGNIHDNPELLERKEASK
jgi:uncharacterized phage protein (TIGR01671 family)